jgi:hypothetical protein
MSPPALADFIVDTRAELMEPAVASGLRGLQQMLEDDSRASAARGTCTKSMGAARRYRGE